MSTCPKRLNGYTFDAEFENTAEHRHIMRISSTWDSAPRSHFELSLRVVGKRSWVVEGRAIVTSHVKIIQRKELITTCTIDMTKYPFVY